MKTDMDTRLNAQPPLLTPSMGTRTSWDYGFWITLVLCLIGLAVKAIWNV